MNIREGLHYFFRYVVIGTWRANLLVLFLILMYFLLLKFPGFIFDKKVTYRSITLYSSENVKYPYKILERVDTLIKSSKVYMPGEQFKIYVASSNLQYKLFAPLSGKSFGVYYPLINNIFINAISPKTLKVLRTSDNKSREAADVIAHEINHRLLHRDLGLYEFLTLPKWKNEGYCEYVSGTTTISNEEGLGLIKKGLINKTGSGRYFLYAKVVRYLLDTKEMEFKSFLRKDMDWNTVKNEYIRSINK